jgi:hypothetical protein
MGVSIWYVINNHFTLTFAFMMNLCWGLQDSGVNVFAECICGFQFKGHLEMPFSIYFFCQSFMCFVGTYVCSALTSPTAYVIFYIGSAVLALASWGIFAVFFEVLEESDETGEHRASIAEERRERMSFNGSMGNGSKDGDDADINLAPKARGVNGANINISTSNSAALTDTMV